jgi:phosphopantothenoylcysteine decarboxylase/phosphopantothenate--cysteine ligase
LATKSVLITAGPTWVAIDSVRVISNTATGETGLLLAEKFAQQGARVTLMLGPVSGCCTNKRIKVINFKFFDELRCKLIRELETRNYDLVIHSAAVSDYKPRSIYKAKISSGKKQLQLSMIPTEKIIDRIKKMQPRAFLVGFKLEPGANKGRLLKEAENLIRQAKADLVVANTIDNGKYKACLLGKGKLYGQALNKSALVKILTKVVSERI